MKIAVTIGVLVVLAVVSFNRAVGPGAGPDTPVVVHTADPVKVLLPANPDAETIRGYVYAALVDAARHQSGILADDLRAMAGDGSLLDWIGDSGATRFSSNQAAALAYPLYRTTVTTSAVTITSTTVELLPQYWNIGGSISHEDGHATINAMLAEQCGSGLVARYGSEGLRGGSLEVAIQNALHDLGNDAHGRYHEVVNGSRQPAHARAARAAADAVIEARC